MEDVEFGLWGLIMLGFEQHHQHLIHEYDKSEG
jgi:hypothetical protein